MGRLVALLASAALALPVPAHAAPPATALDLDGAVDAFSGTAAVVLADPAAGYRYARNDDVEFVSASLYKLAVMVETYRQRDAGALALDETFVVVAEQDLPHDEPWVAAPGTTLSVRDALELAITWSDNSTALALVRVLGPREVATALAHVGLTSTRLDAIFAEHDGENVTTARDMERLFTLLLRGEVVSPDASAEMLELLARQHINDRIPSGLPDGALVAHKTGDVYDQSHDAGLVWTPFGPRVVVVLTAHARRDEAASLAASVARVAYSADLAPREAPAECPSGELVLP